MFRNSWVHPQGDGFICIMAYAFWRIGEFPIHHTAHTVACKTYHTAYTNVSLRMDPRGSKHIGEN